jgi:hypothetical protein
MWEGSSSRKFGASTYGVIGGGNHIAAFDDPVHGAAAQFDLLGSQKYINRPVSDVIKDWSADTGGAGNVQDYVKSLGLSPDAVITPELLRSPQGIALAKKQAHWEAGLKKGEEYPLTDDQWQMAQQLAFEDQ